VNLIGLEGEGIKEIAEAARIEDRNHTAGADLTDSLARAPHGAELLQRFPIVGELVEDRV